MEMMSVFMLANSLFRLQPTDYGTLNEPGIDTHLLQVFSNFIWVARDIPDIVTHTQIYIYS